MSATESKPTPAAGGDGDNKNPVGANQARGSNKQNQQKGKSHNNSKIAVAEPFKGEIPGLGPIIMGDTAAKTRAAVAKVDKAIMSKIGREQCHENVTKSLMEGKLIYPDEPVPDVVEKDGETVFRNKIAEKKFDKEYDKHLDIKADMDKQLNNAYYVYRGQCSPGVIVELKEHEDYDEMEKKKCVFLLRKMLLNLTVGHKNQSTPPVKNILQAVLDFFGIHQYKKEPNEDYLKRYKIALKTVKEICGCEDDGVPHVFMYVSLLDLYSKEHNLPSWKQAGWDVNTKHLKIQAAKMEAMHFLLGADKARYGDIITEFDRAYLSGQDKYPTDLQKAFVLLRHWNDNRKKSTPQGPPLDKELGLSFHQAGKDNEGGDGKETIARRKCDRCGKYHKDACTATHHADGTVLYTSGTVAEMESGDDNKLVSTCPEPDGPKSDCFVHCSDFVEAHLFVQSNGYSGENQTNSTSTSNTMLFQTNSTSTSSTMLVMDSGSSVNLVSNEELLTDIYESDVTLTVRCNAGVKQTRLRGRLRGYGFVWLSRGWGVANVISLSRTKEKFRVTYDSLENSFNVIKDDGSMIQFTERSNRLYCFDPKERTEQSTILITTVANNKLKFSGQDVAKADLARKLQRVTFRPSTADLIEHINKKAIKNCPVSAQDVRNAEIIYGPDVGSLQGKTTWTQPSPVDVQYISIPPQIMEHYKNVTLSVDVMFVMKIPILTTISRHIKFGTAGRLESMKKEHILRHFKRIISTYVVRGFRVTIILGDNQFECLRTELADLHVLLHICAPDEHVHEIERFNRTIKERVRATINTVPYNHFSPVLVAEMVFAAVFWRNMFIMKNGVSPTMSPSEIILNRSLDVNAHCKVGFGDYVQTHEEHDNSMDSRTIGAIALRPANSDNSYYFYSLVTGRRIIRRSWTDLPVDQTVIDTVHRLARRANAKKTVTFTNADGVDLDVLYADLDRDEDDLPLAEATAGVVDNNIDDDDEDSDYVDNGSTGSGSDDDDNYYHILGDDDEDDDGNNEEEESDNENAHEMDDDDLDVPDVNNNENIPDAEEDTVQNTGVDDSVQNTGVGDEASEAVPMEPDAPVELPGVEDQDTENNENDGTAEVEDAVEPDNAVDVEDAAAVEDAADDEEQTERECGNMTLRSQPRREYNVFVTTDDKCGENKASGDVRVQSPRMFSKAAVDKIAGVGYFNNLQSEVAIGAEMVMLTLSDDNESGIEETKLDPEDLELAQVTAECMFLTGHMGWKEGLDSNDMPLSEYTLAMEEIMLVTEQMNWKKGLKVFHEQGKGDLAEEAITKELKQIHDMQGFQPKHWYEMTKEERAEALNYLMYLKEKRNGIIKGRGCADGRPQRLYTTKMEASSPTVRQASIMLSCMIDAHQGRDVATVDIPGAFLQTKWPKGEKDVHVMLDGEMAMLLAKVDPATYMKYIHHRRGQPYIYCRLNVALYGTLLAAVLFWRKLSKFLIDSGFEVNAYDWCVVNKMIDGKQCTILWHVDDLKISHENADVVTDVIKMLEEEYGKVGKLSITRGPIHDYLGQTLDFSDPKKVVVDMEKFFDGVLEDLPDDMDGYASTPAADHLFKTRDDAPKLDKERAELFHSKTAQILFGSQRARPDLRLVVSFLTKRVNEPDEDDYKKLARAMKYIRRTKFLRLTIEAEYLDQNHWFIDGAFAVHDDMKSHTGGYMTFGRGMIDGSSSGQKINTTSSTEAEVVGVHDNMPAILWTRYFMEAQGFPLKPSVIHQDNMSAMLLETNGRGSSGKRTRHMNVRYFFVADVVKRKEAVLRYCPTDEMIGDFFTKPLGGAKFRRFRNIIMNISHDEHGPVDVDELMAIHYDKMKQKINESGAAQTDAPGSQECVGNQSEQAKQPTLAKKPTYADVVSS